MTTPDHHNRGPNSQAMTFETSRRGQKRQRRDDDDRKLPCESRHPIEMFAMFVTAFEQSRTTRGSRSSPLQHVCAGPVCPLHKCPFPPSDADHASISTDTRKHKWRRQPISIEN